jgi:tRNA U54 and U55 pseudouridine synthase Pus10
MNDLIDCPYCAEKIRSKAIICRFCRKELNTEDVIERIRVNKIKKEIAEKYEKIKDLKFRLEDKINLYFRWKDTINLYPNHIKNKIINDLDFLERLENMSSDEIKQDVFYEIEKDKIDKINKRYIERLRKIKNLNFKLKDKIGLYPNHIKNKIINDL